MGRRARSRQAWTVSCSADVTKFVLQPLTQVECVCTPLYPSVAPGLTLDSNSEVCQYRWPPSTSFHLQVVVLEQWSMRNALACSERSDSSPQCKTGIWHFQSFQERVQLAAAAVAWFLFTCQRKMFLDTASATLCRKRFLFSSCCRRARQARRCVRGERSLLPQSVLDYVVRRSVEGRTLPRGMRTH